MTKCTVGVALMTALLVGDAGDAMAQRSQSSEGPFLSIEAGAQPQQRTIETSSSFPLYDETATVTSSQTIHNGPVFGVSGGYRIRPQLGVGVGISSFRSRESDGLVRASIPDIEAYDRPKVVSVTASGLKRSELGIHFQAVWFHPVNDKMEIVLAAGPSILHVKQDLATGAAVQTGPQNVTVVQETQSKSALGLNAGVEGNYLFNPRYGLGLFLRYAGGTVDLPAASDVKVGGLQIGLGLRARF